MHKSDDLFDSKDYWIEKRISQIIKEKRSAFTWGLITGFGIGVVIINILYLMK